MSVLIVIPARYASTRYPGKPLVALTGASGKKQTLIERSWRAAVRQKTDPNRTQLARGLRRVWCGPRCRGHR